MTTKNGTPFRGGWLLAATGGIVAALAGCATIPPTNELANARTEYAEASEGQAARYVPADVQEAQVALRAAEAKHEDDPGSDEERNLSYVAWRKAQLANAHGIAQAARVEAKATEDRYSEMQDELRRAAEGDLEASQDSLDKTQDQLAAEKAARAQTELQLAAAIKSLGDIGKVKEEGGNLTITLDGSVLFETDKATLLPTAKDKLQKVAEVLMQQPDGKSMVVYGHTDSSGADAYNQTLSQSRADSVRAYLIERGVAASLIEARGMGEGQPITSNDTPEGRANNRRVEIVVSNKKK